MFLEVGVLDVNTCEPLANAYVDVWHCNSTGYYSKFTGVDPNIDHFCDTCDWVCPHTAPCGLEQDRMLR